MKEPCRCKNHSRKRESDSQKLSFENLDRLSSLRRRTFLKTVGGASAAAVISLKDLVVNAEDDEDGVSVSDGVSKPKVHCDWHGASCKWIDRIEVTFTKSIDTPDMDAGDKATRPNSAKSGRIFTGNMVIVYKVCDGKDKVDEEESDPIAVQTGGYTVGDPIVAGPGNDTAMPDGTWPMQTSQTGGTAKGFDIGNSQEGNDGVPMSDGEGNSNGRTFMELHNPILKNGGTHGCISCQSWDDVRKAIKKNHPNGKTCFHGDIPSPIPITITYDMEEGDEREDGPQGNAPDAPPEDPEE